MSDSISTPSPISGSRLDDDNDDLTSDDLTDDLDLGFDGAEDILRSWRKGMRPDPDLTVSEWADAHRWLSSRAAAEPGRYRTARAPYLREIMDALSPRHPAQRISFMKAAQVGATEAGNNWIGFVIHHAPGPMLAVLPTVELAKRTSRGRLDPLIAESPALRERVNPARSRDAGNSMLSNEFPGGILVLTGANSATGLRSMPARYIFLDEVDAYPASADEEGDPVTLAEARTTTFSHRRKVFMVPEAVHDQMQRELEVVRFLFAETVAAGRGDRLNHAAALATEAAVFRGADAIAAGLADDLADPVLAFRAFAAAPRGTTSPSRKGPTMTTTPTDTPNPAPVAAAPVATEPTIVAASIAPNAAAMTVDGVRAEAAEVAQVCAQAARLGVQIDAADAVTRGLKPEALRARVLADLAARSDAAGIIATAPAAAAAKDSPIIAAAKKAATDAKR